MGFTKVIKSGDLLEIFQYENDLIPQRKKRKPKWKRIWRPKPDRIRPDNIYRKKREFARLVRANLEGAVPPAMFSFTVVECSDLTVGYSFLTDYFARLRRSHGKAFRYIAVPEFQKRGAVHFHALIWGLPEEEIKNETPHWDREEDIGDMGKIKRGTRHYQNIWARGYLDCMATDGSEKLAGYLAKYMSKAMFDKRLLGQKSYSASRNVLRSVRLPFASAVAYSKEIWGIDLSTDVPLQERIYQSKYLGTGRYRVYKIN